MAGDTVPTDSGAATEAPWQDLATLFHRLNNQLGTGLAHAELIEIKASTDAARSRASQVIHSMLEAMTTAREILGRVIDSGPSAR